jgi:hypothetical protein
MIELITIVLFVALYVIGGQIKGWLRDIPCPLLLGVYMGFKIGILGGILTWIGANIMRLGYGNWSPEDDSKPCLLAHLIHDRGGEYIRATWGFLVALGIGGAYVYYTHNYIYYFLYIIGNSFIGYAVSKAKLNVFFTDLLVSLSIASIICLQ